MKEYLIFVAAIMTAHFLNIVISSILRVMLRSLAEAWYKAKPKTE